jgi:hypothetical protein
MVIMVLVGGGMVLHGDSCGMNIGVDHCDASSRDSVMCEKQK